MTDGDQGSRAIALFRRAGRAVRRFGPGGGHPARTVFSGFGAAILLGTLLLMLPIATEDGTVTDVITALFTPVGHLILTALMFIGRLGPITAATAFALRERRRRYERPEERPIVG